MAPTGTGKTAAFALPLLSRVDLKQRSVQVLVLAPTRELAIQVAEAFQKYAAELRGFHVLPIYGGSDYRGQLRQQISRELRHGMGELLLGPQIHQGRSLGSQPSALINWRQPTGLPVLLSQQNLPIGIVQCHIRRQVLVLRP